MRYFDSRDTQLNAKHVIASGALPPAFPAVRIDGDLYWDGGILSNTPVEAVFDDYPRRNSLMFVVRLWNSHGSEPETIWQVLNRRKDIQYASRAVTHTVRQKQLHRLRHVVSELVKRIPEQRHQTPEVQSLAEYGCLTRMHVVRLLAPTINGEDHTKDIDFSPSGIRARSAAGYADTSRVITMAPWEGEFDPMEGIILHEARQEHRLAAADALNPLSSAWGACKSSGLPSVGVSPRDDMDSGLRAADCEAVRAAQSTRRQRQRYARLRRIISPAHRSRRRRPRRIPARVLAFGEHQTIPAAGSVRRWGLIGDRL